MARPKWVQDAPKFHDLWDQPWTVSTDPAKNKDFKAQLVDHGLLSPHFSLAEAASKADNCGCPKVNVSGQILTNAQQLCFKVERVRHALGDRPIGVLDIFRSKCHNGCVPGSATQSEHMTGRAIDPTNPAGIDWHKFDDAFKREFASGGIGTGSVTGHVVHVDTGPKRTWTYAGR